MYVTGNTQKRNCTASWPPCISHRGSRKGAYNRHSPFVFEMALDSVSCHFLLCVLDLLVRNPPHPVFIMENKLLRPPDNGENEMSASCFPVYKALPSRLFHVIPTIDLPFMTCHIQSAPCLASSRNSLSGWFLGRHYHPRLQMEGSERLVQLTKATQLIKSCFLSSQFIPWDAMPSVLLCKQLIWNHTFHRTCPDTKII